MSHDNLASKLRSATHEAHREAERAGVMAEFLRGTLSLSGYQQLLVNLRQVYAALESALDKHIHDAPLDAFGLAALKRGEALDADLRELGVASNDLGLMLPLTQEFCSRITLLADSPELLIAHAYVRYLGDLNGGQTLKRLVAKTYPGPVAKATSFYQFGDEAAVAGLIGRFREALKEIPDRNGLHQRIIDEALLSFDFHRRLFVSLAEPLKSPR
jgi:heme oxygenase